MRRALVTGSTGFIGTWLTRDLVKKGIEVYALVRRGSGKLASLSELDARVVECDMREYSELPDIIKARDIDAVFHIAWNGVTGVNARDQLVQLKTSSILLTWLTLLEEWIYRHSLELEAFMSSKQWLRCPTIKW